VLRDYLLGVLSAPLSDKEVTRLLADRSPEAWTEFMESWLADVKCLHPRLVLRKNTTASLGSWLVFDCMAPYAGTVGFAFLDVNSLAKLAPMLARVREEVIKKGVTHPIFVICADVSNPQNEAIVDAAVTELEFASPDTLVMEPAWAAALLVEHLMPVLRAVDEAPDVSDTPPYFSATALPTGVSVRRARVPLQSMFGAVIGEPGTFAQKFKQLQLEDHFDGTILLATTFLPPVSHSLSAIKRFDASYGVTEGTLVLIGEKWEWEQREWVKHISRCKRVDIFDKSQLEEYFGAAEYYQMPFTTNELKEQLDNTLKLLRYENYSVCLTSEAINLTYEVRGPEVRVRSDRRNKGQPRSGRISGIVFNDTGMAEVFEGEFWNMYRLAPAESKNKEYIAEWLRERVSKYKGPGQGVIAGEEFDVFLCYNSRDRLSVKKIGRKLVEKGLRPWLDEWNLVPGRPWQRALESQIGQIRSAAAFVGADGIGPWQHLELDAFLREFVNRGCPVIPVILSNVQKPPDLPVFLKGMHWVDSRSHQPDPYDQLIWGIRGKR